MNKIEIRLYYTKNRSCGCCSCTPDESVVEFEGLAERLAEKFGDNHLKFEAYGTIDTKKFPFMIGVKLPAVSVGDKAISSGKLPKYSEIENEVKSIINGE